MVDDQKNDSSESDSYEVINTNGPVQIIRGNDDHTFTLCENELAAILMSQNLKDTPVVVVSVAGAFRKGKSFLLDFILRYLINEGREGWMGDPNEELAGFKWRGGTNRETNGIWLWGQPFIKTNPTTGEKVAILLMDTQGTFDTQATIGDNVTIFALSTMLSSVQIYNISQRISEDDLQHLHLFTDYGRLAMHGDSEEGRNKPFQRLEFLIRDWPCEYEFQLGAEGGHDYLNKILAVSENQHPQLQEVRNHITNCFETVGCYLLPYPGRMVAAKPEFKGKICDMEEDFASCLEKLIPYFLHESTLAPKRIHGQALKGKDLLHYFKSYVEIYQQDTLPEAMTMLQATAEANNLSALASAQEFYTEEMGKKVGGDRGYMNETELTSYHAECCELADKEFNSTRKIGGPELSKTYLDKLEKFMEDQLQQYIKINESKNIFKSARTPITLFIVLAVAYVAHGILAALYLGPLALFSNIIFWGAMSTLGVWISLKWKGEQLQIAEKIDHVAEVIWEQGMLPVYGVVLAAGTAAAIKHAQTSQHRRKSKTS